MEFLELVVKYWAQITVLLLGVGYIFKTYFDWRIRKKEILFNYIKTTKIQELKSFYDSYYEVDSSIKNLFFNRSNNDEVLRRQLQEKFLNSWNDFYKNFLFLRIFLSGDELTHFSELVKEFEDIWKKLINFEIDKQFKTVDKNLFNQLSLIRDEVFPKKLPSLLDSIEKKIKKDFGIK